MITLNIKVDKLKQATVEAALSGIKNGAQKAMSRAINRTVTYGKTQALRIVRKEYTINAKSLNDATRIYTTRNTGALRGAISFTGRPKQLRSFARKINRNGIFVNVKRSTGFKRLTRRAFVNTVSSGPALLMRLGDSRYPIEVLHGPAVPQMTGNVNVGPKIQEKIANKLNERVDHEMSALLKGYVK